MNEDFPDEPQDQEGDENLGLFRDISEIWRDPPGEPSHPDEGDVIRRETLPNALTNIFFTEMRTSDMTNLGHILMGRTDELDETITDPSVSRLTLSHQKLEHMPRLICDEFGPRIRILDISNNLFRNLDFLEHFKEVTSLVLDRNPLNVQDTNIPWMPKLELLYLNFCKIDELYWVESLRYNCPNLRYLSLMGNPVAPSPLIGGNMYEYLRYRLHVISILPKLVHLDDKHITDDERKQSTKMFPTPVFQNIVRSTRSRLPHYLRRLTGRVSNYFSSRSARRLSSRQNNIVI